MAAIDKIYGTNKQYDEFKKWLKENQKPIRIAYEYDLVKRGDRLVKRNVVYKMVLPSKMLYARNNYADIHYRPISNFPTEINKWLLKNCPIDWVVKRIKEQYNIK